LETIYLFQVLIHLPNYVINKRLPVDKRNDAPIGGERSRSKRL